MMHKSNNDTDVCDVTACFSIGIQVKVWSTIPTVVLVQNHTKTTWACDRPGYQSLARLTYFSSVYDLRRNWQLETQMMSSVIQDVADGKCYSRS